MVCVTVWPPGRWMGSGMVSLRIGDSGRNRVRRDAERGVEFYSPCVGDFSRPTSFGRELLRGGATG
jgi:hypothetical protein